jgi:hypothetical protein
MASNEQSRPGSKRRECKLEAPGWSDKARAGLQEVIQGGAGKQLPVVFDFDNTIVCGDAGEATLAVLARTGQLKASRLPRTLCPPFQPEGRGKVALKTCADVTEYYEALLAPTAHGANDPTPFANAYVWAVEVMEGLRPLDIINATRAAFEFSRKQEKPAYIEVTPGKTAFPAPFFYEEMVELIAELLRHQFDVWILSASNVWTVRWMVLQGLNPRLRRMGAVEGIRADHIIGISTLLSDRSKRLYKDALLVREHAGYAALDRKTLGLFRLTSRLQFPVPTYSGKLACLHDSVGRRPYLCVGDGRGDHAMLAFSQHRLWLARLEKPDDQQSTLELIRKTGPTGWIVQPILSREKPGFVAELESLPEVLGDVPRAVHVSAGILSTLPGWSAV